MFNSKFDIVNNVLKKYMGADKDKSFYWMEKAADNSEPNAIDFLNEK